MTRMVLLAFAFVCAVIAVTDLVSDRVRLIAASLAFYYASMIL